MDDVLVTAQFFQPHGAAGMQLLGGDAHFAAQAELAAIGETGGAVDIDGGAVHSRREQVGVGRRPGQDDLAVSVGVLGDVANGMSYDVDHLEGEDVVK